MGSTRSELISSLSSKIFNSTPNLNGSREASSTKNGSRFVNETFRNLVERHNLESVFGIGLLHRHFDLKNDEKLVEFNNISTPWHHQEGDVYTGGKIIPNAWLINDGKLMPYEFYFSPLGRNKKIDLAAVNNFLKEFIENAVAAKLDRTIALRAFPGVGYTGALEVTEGRANIDLKPDEVYHDVSMVV